MEQDIIRKIIEMDKEARRLTEEARQRREKSEAAAAEIKKEVGEQYTEMVLQRLELVREAELEEAQEQLEAELARTKKAEEELERLFEQNRESWVKKLCLRAVKLGEQQ